MKKKSKIILGVILLSILLMGIGYAALANIDLTITGLAKAAANNDNFKVYFTAANTTTNPDTVTDGVDDVEVIVTNGDINATVNFNKGLTKKDDEVYAILEITNGSNGVDASSVNVTATGDDEVLPDDYFTISAEMCDINGTPITDYSLAVGEFTYVKVKAKLNVTPTEDVQANLNVTVTAVPAAQ